VAGVFPRAWCPSRHPGQGRAPWAASLPPAAPPVAGRHGHRAAAGSWAGPGTPSSAKLACSVATPAMAEARPASRARSCGARAGRARPEGAAARAEDPGFARPRRRRRACEISVDVMVTRNLFRIWVAAFRRPPRQIRGNQLAHRARYDRRALMTPPHDMPCTSSVPHAVPRARRSARRPARRPIRHGGSRMAGFPPSKTRAKTRKMLLVFNYMCRF